MRLGKWKESRERCIGGLVGAGLRSIWNLPVDKESLLQRYSGWLVGASLRSNCSRSEDARIISNEVMVRLDSKFLMSVCANLIIHEGVLGKGYSTTS